MTGAVLYSPEFGVFVGHALGMAFWTKIDPAGQEYAPAFESEEDAMRFLASWPASALAPEELESIRPVLVVPDYEAGGFKYASSAACVAAGLPGWITEMTQDEHAEVYGERPVMH